MKQLELIKAHYFKKSGLAMKIARDVTGTYYIYQYWLNAYVRLSDACQSYLKRQAETMTIQIDEPDYRRCYFIAD